MKYLIITLLTFITLTSYSQGYKSRLETYRKQYQADFLTDKNSPLKEADLKNLRFYDPDSTYRITADVEVLPTEPSFMIPTFNGAKQEYVRYGRVKFVLNGKLLHLTIYSNTLLAKRPGFADYLFMPFTDQTNGKETYGGGRYLDLKTTDIKNGHLEIDFNKAYNPYCAYSAGYQCPMPPQENDLALKVQAGEKQYTGEKKH
ncbi:DUF1684 domain-containing protein [Mucilaginibacter rigui]|uniref:DUF1684 domain-containing protein n=1 Tax=Mucilaginibacter rigui TaxID=534635 RepID=A0ABR7X6G0_9SPHI|nr:DUF1684 domain-containing protein [Mucilaginibacter rigui]MBD1386140.1 DUF1684 domain-containing protein [Mucilaginibacter rigui]